MLAVVWLHAHCDKHSAGLLKQLLQRSKEGQALLEATASPMPASWFLSKLNKDSTQVPDCFLAPA